MICIFKTKLEVASVKTAELKEWFQKIEESGPIFTGLGNYSCWISAWNESVFTVKPKFRYRRVGFTTRGLIRSCFYIEGKFDENGRLEVSFVLTLVGFYAILALIVSAILFFEIPSRFFGIVFFLSGLFSLVRDFRRCSSMVDSLTR